MVYLAACPSGDGDPIVAPRIDGATLDTQAKLDAFGAQGFAAFVDRLVIEESLKLADMSGLTGLRSIGGSTTIIMNGIIATLDGLNDLATIGGDLAIEQNPNLKRIDGLSRLKSLGGTVLVSKNDLIVDLSGRPKSSSVDGGLIFLNNAALADYCGLQNILFVGLNGIYSAVGNAANPSLAGTRAAFCD